MIRTTPCAQAEILGGAIALGEADDAERDAYRRHIAACSPCLQTLGGEREIERTMSVVAQARDAETWQPEVASLLNATTRRRNGAWRWSGALAAAALVALAGGYAATHALEGGHPHVALTISKADLAKAPAPLTTSKAPAAYRIAAVPERRLVVVHNTVTLPRLAAAPARPHAAAHAPVTQTAGAPARVAQPIEIAAAAPSERERTSVSAMKTVAGAPASDSHAESLAVVGTTRDVVPLGGDGAIVPRPTAIAYAENAEGTTAFEVAVDERGAPQKCNITKPSGYLVLDDAVCRAAMHARYAPRLVNGRATPGVYTDAFTFRAHDQ